MEDKVKPIILNDNAVLGELDVILEQSKTNSEKEDNKDNK